MRTLWILAVVGLLVVGLGCKSEDESAAEPTESSEAEVNPEEPDEPEYVYTSAAKELLKKYPPDEFPLPPEGFEQARKACPSAMDCKMTCKQSYGGLVVSPERAKLKVEPGVGDTYWAGCRLGDKTVHGAIFTFDLDGNIIGQEIKVSDHTLWEIDYAELKCPGKHKNEGKRIMRRHTEIKDGVWITRVWHDNGVIYRHLECDKNAQMVKGLAWKEDGSPFPTSPGLDCNASGAPHF